MTGTLSQLIVLTAYGNDFLRNGNLPDDFYPANAAFKFCNKVRFIVFTRIANTAEFTSVAAAENPEDWFTHLREDGCWELRLYFVHSKDSPESEDHKTAGFIGGGGHWYIEAVYENYSNYWQSSWEASNRKEHESSPWSVTYAMTVGRQQICNLQFDQEDAKENLRLVLKDISAFAMNRKLTEWVNQFEDALRILQIPDPQGNYYQKDLLPQGNYSLTARQQLFAAGTAWVFGGMGSWNDLGFDNSQDRETYSKLSVRLYSAINHSVIASVNSY